jgi:hypothetical protein
LRVFLSDLPARLGKSSTILFSQNHTPKEISTMEQRPDHDFSRRSITASGLVVTNLRPSVIGNGAYAGDAGEWTRVWKRDGTHKYGDDSLNLIYLDQAKPEPVAPVFSWIKPYQCKGGWMVENVRSASPNTKDGCMAGDLVDYPGESVGRLWASDGTHVFGDKSLDLVNYVPEAPAFDYTKPSRTIIGGHHARFIGKPYTSGDLMAWIDALDESRYVSAKTGKHSFGRPEYNLENYVPEVKAAPAAAKKNEPIYREGDKITVELTVTRDYPYTGSTNTSPLVMACDLRGKMYSVGIAMPAIKSHTLAPPKPPKPLAVGDSVHIANSFDPVAKIIAIVGAKAWLNNFAGDDLGTVSLIALKRAA